MPQSHDVIKPTTFKNSIAARTNKRVSVSALKEMSIAFNDAINKFIKAVDNLSDQANRSTIMPSDVDKALESTLFKRNLEVSDMLKGLKKFSLAELLDFIDEVKKLIANPAQLEARLKSKPEKILA